MPPPNRRPVRVWHENVKLAYSLRDLADAMDLDASDIPGITSNDPTNDNLPLRGFKVGNDWYVPVTEIQRWMTANLQTIQ